MLPQGSSGADSLEQRLAEIKAAVEYGATEIDMVIPRTTVLTSDWQTLYDDVKACREACGGPSEVHFATGNLGTLENVYKASLVAMMAGTDFVKTSTGRGRQCHFPCRLHCGARHSGLLRKDRVRCGFKPAGGFGRRLPWMVCADERRTWRHGPSLISFELVSSLLGDIERQLYRFVHKKYAARHEFPSA